MTDIEIYDRAVYAYLNTIADRIIYAPADIAIREITKKYPGSTENTGWCFISYYRDPSFEIDYSRDSFSARQIGDRATRAYDPETGKLSMTTLRTIPVNLSYTVDIWAARNATVQEVAINLVHQIQTNPSSAVFKASMGLNEEAVRYHFQSLEWTDNSDLVNDTEHGRIYRHTISFTLAANLKWVTTTQKTPFEYTNIPIVIYEGDDLYDQVCEECDFEYLNSKCKDEDETN